MGFGRVPPQQTETLETATDAVEAALDQALQFPAESASDTELCEWVIRSPRLRAKFDALMARATAAADRADVSAVLDLRKTDQVVGAKTGGDPAIARVSLRIGSWMQDFPGLESAFAAGDLTTEHLELIRIGCDNTRTHAALIRDQELFIEHATTLPFVKFKVAARYWAHVNDPDGEEPRDQVVSTRLRAVRLADGTVSVTGRFDPLMGQALLTALHEEEEKLFRTDAEDDVSRSVGKRRADALIGLISRGHDQGGSGTPRALINIVMSQSVAEQTLERLDNALVEVELDPTDVDGRCEFLDGHPLHPALALATLGVATLRRHVMDATGRMLDVSLNARAFPDWMKNAALIESRGLCSEPGCDAPFHWLQGDHRKPDSKGGATSYENLDPLCGPGNRHKGDRWDKPGTGAG